MKMYSPWSSILAASMRSATESSMVRGWKWKGSSRMAPSASERTWRSSQRRPASSASAPARTPRSLVSTSGPVLGRCRIVISPSSAISSDSSANGRCPKPRLAFDHSHRPHPADFCGYPRVVQHIDYHRHVLVGLAGLLRQQFPVLRTDVDAAVEQPLGDVDAL